VSERRPLDGQGSRLSRREPDLDEPAREVIKAQLAFFARQTDV
jgi:hypothetical protein